MLTFDAIQLAFQIFEKGFAPFSINRYRSKRNLIDLLLTNHALLQVGLASHIHVPARSEDVEVEIEVDAEHNLAWYKCPETHKRRNVPLDEARLLQISPDWVRQYLMDSLSIPKHLQRKQVLEHDTIWHLGAAVIDRAPANIYLVRALKTRADKILAVLHSQTTPPSALIISFNPPPVSPLALPAQMHLATIANLFVPSENTAVVNIRYLEHLLSGGNDVPDAEPASYFRQRDDFAELCLRGRKGTFKKLQAEIIGYLWEHRNVESGVSWAEIANAAHSNSRGIDDAMGGKSIREEWIDKISRGRFRLRSH